MTLLGPAQVRELAVAAGVRPSKRLGQNFVIDANTVQMITRRAGVQAHDVVLEIGPGLGSLTLALLETGARVIAVELDGRMAEQLPSTVARFEPDAVGRLTVVHGDAVHMAPGAVRPTKMVANLPYNVGVPILLNILQRFPSISDGMIMVQWEVAERLTASPGTRSYGVPTVKTAWWASTEMAGRVGTDVFWPAPNVRSGLVSFTRHEPLDDHLRPTAFAAIDGAFAQRRKTLRSSLSAWAGSTTAAEELLAAAGIDSGYRGERLLATDFARLASAKLAARTP